MPPGETVPMTETTTTNRPAGGDPDRAFSPPNRPATGGRRASMRVALTLVAGSALLFVLGRTNYLAFHSLIELFSIAVAWSVFLLTWNVRRVIDDDALVFLGVAFACIGTVDLLHTLAYKGMGVFTWPPAPNLPTQLWIGARYLEAGVLLAWTLLLGRRIPAGGMMAALGAATLALVASIFAGMFPDCLIEGQGLTPFKVGSEYVISALMGLALVNLARRRRHVPDDVFRYMAWAIALKIASELAFTLYVDVYGYTNMAGHMIKAVAVALVYLALVRAGLTRPYAVLLHEYQRRIRDLDTLDSQWRAFLGNAEWPMVVVDGSGRIIEANEAAERAAGADGTLQGRAVPELVPAEAADAVGELFARAAADGRTVVENFDVRGDGDLVLEVTVFAASAPEDARRRFGFVVRDVTLRYREEKRHERIIETALDGIWITDTEGVIIEANEAAARMLGYSLDEMEGMSIASIEVNETRDEVVDHIARIGGVYRERFETRHRRRDGIVIDVEVCASRLPGDEGRLVAFVRDVTGRKRSESLMAARVRLSECAFEHTLPELLQYTLDEAERLTESTIGFMHFMEEDQTTLSLQRWSTNTLKHMCTAEGAGQHYPVSQAGVWADCVRLRGPVIHNDYASLPDKRGMPPGHAEVVREVVVPVIRQDKVVAILGVGNKPEPYTDDDVELVNQLADLAWDIAGSKRAQVELSESEDRYRSLFEHLLDPVLVVDAETMAIVDANIVARNCYGLAAGDQSIGNALDLHDPAERREVAALLRGGAADPWRTWTHVDAEGRSVPVRIRTSAMTVRGRRQVVLIARDVTAELQAEQEQAERTAHLSTLIASISDVITILDAEGLIRFESPNVEDRFGYGPGERNGHSVAAYVHADDREQLIRVIGRVAVETGRSENCTLRLMHRDGSWRLVDAVVRNLMDDEHIGGILFNYRDITESRLAEDRFRLAFQTSPDGIAITTVDGGVYVDVNRGFEEMSGYSREDLLGRSAIEVGIWPSADERRKVTEPLRLAGTARNIEITYGRADGSQRIGLISANYISLAGDPHILSITRDITELRKVEQDRLQLEFQLQQAQKLESVGRLAGGIAHDFNNLLTVISGNAELARMTLGDDHAVVGEIDMISRTAERAAALTGQLLAYSREQASEPRPVSIRDLVMSDVRLVQRMIGEEVELTTDCPPSRHLVEADPVQVQQVLFNLCINARDAMPSGGRLTVATRDVFAIDRICDGCGEPFSGDYCELSVRDNGSGISPENLGRIFDPFFTTKEVGKGTGMGLATALGIITKAGGHIMATSTEGQGTVFRVYLPHHRARASAPVVGERSEVMRGKGERILVVEDDAGVQTTIVSVLERFGYRVSMAHDPLAAIAMLEQGGAMPDLVLSDVVMPRMNGEQLLQEMRGRDWKVPFLFMSGYPADLLHGRRLLAADRPYLRKPVPPGDLLRAVREQLDTAKI
jgi:PAS domain S-box-containing protein